MDSLISNIEQGIMNVEGLAVGTLAFGGLNDGRANLNYEF